MTEARNPKGLLDRNEAAEYLSIGLSTLQRLVNSKELRAVKVLTATRYAIADLDAYIERLRRSA